MRYALLEHQERMNVMACKLIYGLSGSYLALTGVTGEFQDERVIFVKGGAVLSAGNPLFKDGGNLPMPLFPLSFPSEFPRTPPAGSPLSEKDLFWDSR
jgi:hypothetical protein